MSSFLERFADFEREPPADLFGDPIWRLPAYRIALFMNDIAREDVAALIRDGAPGHIHNQLERAVNSIGANLEEGYARLSGKERARYFEMALGSAREARGWYRQSKAWLGSSAAMERGMLLTRVVKILTVVIPRERDGESERRMLREPDRTKRKASERRGAEPAPAPAPAISNQPEQPAPVTSLQQSATSAAIPRSYPARLSHPTPRPSPDESFNKIDRTEARE